jgi:methylenetetrahydrofolate dehydrogenase (NADP+)/methenyltetrahydrofolate cyclohydrolase
MQIPCKQITDELEKELKKEVTALKKKKKTIKLVVFLIGTSPEQISFVKIKKNTAQRLGIKFEFIHIKTVPPFEKFVRLIKETSQNPDTTGIIIQQPLPATLSTDSVYDFIDIRKEIEGHRRKTEFFSPLGLAVMTLLKYLFVSPKIDKKLFINPKKDIASLKKALKHKKIVIIGRGATGGKPVGKTLADAKINFVSTNTQTTNPTEYYQEADIIVSAVGKKILTPEVLKNGVSLINIGVRKEGGRLKGDYEEKEIKDIASSYTPTPGGIGPLDVLYLYKNLVDAAMLQK